MAHDVHNITPGAYTDSHATPKYNLGTISWANDGTAYRYVQVDDAVDLIVGHVVCYEGAEANGYVVTPDRDSDEASTLAAGVAVAIVDVSANPYCWIQVSGYCATVLGDGSVAAGEFVVPHASTDGAADTMIANTDGSSTAHTEHQAFGLCLTSDTGTPDVFDAILRGII